MIGRYAARIGTKQPTNRRQYLGDESTAMRSVLISCFLMVLGHPLSAEPVQFFNDIAPIIYQNCAPCHHIGGPGPFPLLGYNDVKRHARQIAAVTESRYMPPWLPEQGYGKFTDDRHLTSQQIGLIREWVNQGEHVGDTVKPVSAPKFSPDWQLGEPDLIVRPLKPFTVPAGGPNVFWNFILTPHILTTRYVRAIEIRPQNPRLVHHANLLVDRARTMRLQEKHPGDGFPGMDFSIASDTFDPDSHFLFWKPGSPPYEEPKGMAWRLDPGDDLVLNVHLQPSGKQEEEAPEVGLYFTDQPQTVFPMLIQLEDDAALNIPAGDADFEVSDDFRLPIDVDVLAVYPHAHYLGKLLEGYATLPDKKRQWLIRIPDWDVNWQGVFRYSKPVFLPAGSVISMRYHYDNSDRNPRNPNAPPKWVRGGNQATDEMGHLWLQVLPHGPGDPRMVLQEALMKRRLEKYPEDFGAFFNLGALALARKDSEHAIFYLREAVRIKPEQVIALNALGAAFESDKQLDEAAGLFRRALQLRPNYNDARFNLGNVLGMQGNLNEAADQFRDVLAQNPSDSAAESFLFQVLLALGDSSASKGEFDRAIMYYLEAVRLQPKNADARNLLGMLYARSGKIDLAIEQFQEALKIDPSFQLAQENLRLAREQER
jgi:tetratricopeptide (TPR) repeat protein